MSRALLKQSLFLLLLALPLFARAADPLWIDVRTAEEYVSGHVADAINLPLDTLPEAMSTVLASTSTPVVVYCRSGGRSSQATTTLCASGYCVYDMGAMTNWPK